MCKFSIRSIKNADYRNTLLALQVEGWDVEKTNGGHLRLKHKNAHQYVIAPSSPSCNRAHLNVIAECRRSLMKVVENTQKLKILSEKEFQRIMRKNKASRKQTTATPWAVARNCENPNETRAFDPAPRTHTAIPVGSLTNRNEKPKSKIEEEKKSPDKALIEAETQSQSKENLSVQDNLHQESEPQMTGISYLSPELMAIALDPEALALAQKIANRKLNRIEITADMVGQTLYFEGEMIVTKSNEPSFEADNTQAPDVIDHSDKIMATLKSFAGEFVTTRDLVTLLKDDLGYKSFDSARASLSRKLKKMVAKGVIKTSIQDGNTVFFVDA